MLNISIISRLSLKFIAYYSFLKFKQNAVFNLKAKEKLDREKKVIKYKNILHF